MTQPVTTIRGISHDPASIARGIPPPPPPGNTWHYDADMISYLAIYSIKKRLILDWWEEINTPDDTVSWHGYRKRSHDQLAGLYLNFSQRNNYILSTHTLYIIIMNTSSIPVVFPTAFQCCILTLKKKKLGSLCIWIIPLRRDTTQ
jgi:hypothetical protein